MRFMKANPTSTIASVSTPSRATAARQASSRVPDAVGGRPGKAQGAVISES
jgi:hypothetical protein